MSLLAALAASEAAGPPAAESRVPATSEPVLASLRPDGRVIGEVYVHPTPGVGDATTLTDGCTLAQSIQTARLTAEGLPAARVTPNYRVNIVVAPGTYTERGVAPPPWCAVFGEDPDDRPIVRWTVSGSTLITGVLVTGIGHYIEGLVVERDCTTSTTAWPKYPIHHSSIRTSIFANCQLVTTNGGSNIAGVAIGADMDSDSTTLMYDVDMPLGVTNMHGWPANTGPVTMMYVNCTGNALNFRDDGGAPGSQFWVVGCVANTVDAEGVGTTLHLDPATVVTTVTSDGPQDASTAWPVPTGGLSAADRAHYGMP